MSRVIRIVGIGMLVISAAVLLLLWYLSRRPAVPEDYTERVETGGDLEARYLKMGSYEVAYLEKTVLENFKKYELYYPRIMETSNRLFPAVIVSNGTGIAASRYPALLRHLASWGFIVAATEEEYSWNGFSSEMCLRLLIRLQESPQEDGWERNPFFGHIDLDHIGVCGHSQGGVGVFNAVAEQRHGDMIRAIYAASPSNLELAHALEWDYDVSGIQVPVFLTSSTGQADVGLVVSPEQLSAIYEALPGTTTKVMAVRNDADHGDMLYYADGYMTAWFLWQLASDQEAAKAFVGNSPEILANGRYQDQRADIAGD